ncbi:hypothetical protein EYC98_00825 [Halieaceae bacterium IMCC14734]|uniref:Uncharacterized protein n=1 Tax=Candidatus Litorirhabdus singularis TaxID=2518993 RepID=A0ABT3TAV0_9GAMM|nr:hypothetical protein [Candidatus Litorirhabdus singularis]MCX2979402.1 hypothetical protein [Candidatus Litorirhabdus singularis]
MDRSIGYLLAASLTVSTALAHAVQEDKTPSDPVLAGLQLQDLSPAEMAATEGDLVNFGALFWSLVGGAGFGISNAIEQHQETGEVNLAEVAYVSAGGTAVAGIGIAAGMSGSVTAIVVAGGVSLAVTTAMAFAEEPVTSVAVPVRPTPLLPLQQQPPVNYGFDQSQLPQPGAIYGAEISSVAGAVTLGWGTPFPQAYPQVWGLNEVSAGAGEEHYQYF